MSARLTTIEISKENLKFSAAHFTIFSATERERLHGHNFKVRAAVTATVDDNGMCFNYQEIKSRLRAICHNLDEYTLLPALSPHLSVEAKEAQYRVEFNGETLFFLQRDSKLLAIRNTTVEELSHYILDTLVNADHFFHDAAIAGVTISVSSGDGQWGSSSWTNQAD